MNRSQYSRAVLPTLEPSFGRFFADRLLFIQMSSGTFSTSASPLCQACQVALFLVYAPVSQREILFSQREISLTDRERYLSNTKSSLSVREESLSVRERSLSVRMEFCIVRERNLSQLERISLCEKYISLCVAEESLHLRERLLSV
jgi:hypothetical protein